MSHPANSSQDAATYPPPPPIPQPPPLPAVPVKIWDPLHVALLGIVFTPAWTGAVAAINGHRLGLELLWRPVVIGSLATLLSFMLPAILSLLVYSGSLFLIWRLDLRPQLAVHSKSGSAPDKKLLVPCLVGTPLALLAFMGLVVFPFFSTSTAAKYSSTAPPSQTRPAWQSTQNFDLSEILAQNREREAQRKNTRHAFWGSVVIAKLLGSPGGKAIGLLLLGAAAGLFKLLTRKPSRMSEGSG